MKNNTLASEVKTDESSTYDLMKLDLHVHTELSHDSAISLTDIAPLARSRGLNGLAITDHNRTWTGCLPHGEDLMVIPGIEARTKSYEIIGLFVVELPRRSDPMEVIDDIHSQSGIAVLPHPYAFPRRPPRGSSNLMEVASRVDAIEVFNARNFTLAQNLKAKALAEALGKAEVAGSDAHTPAELGTAYTVAWSAHTLQDVYDKIKRRETLARGSLSSPSVHLRSFMTSFLKQLRRGRGSTEEL